MRANHCNRRAASPPRNAHLNMSHRTCARVFGAWRTSLATCPRTRIYDCFVCHPLPAEPASQPASQPPSSQSGAPKREPSEHTEQRKATVNERNPARTGHERANHSVASETASDRARKPPRERTSRRVRKQTNERCGKRASNLTATTRLNMQPIVPLNLATERAAG